MLNKKQPLKLNLIEFLIILVVAYTIAPIISRFISNFLTTYFYMLVVVLLTLLLFLVRGNKSANDCFVLLFPFICWKALTFFLPKDNIIIWGYSALLDLLPLIIGYYFVNYVDIKKLSFFSSLIVVLLLITGITTIIGCTIYPEAARYLATVADPNEALAVQYDWRNIGGYSFVYMLILVHPLVVLAYKKQKIKKWQALLSSLLIVTVAIYSEYTTAFLMSILSCFLYFFKRTFTAKQCMTWLIAVILFIVLFYTVFAKLFIALADVINSETMAYRLRALAGGREGIENSEDNRVGLYDASMRTFFKYPLFGSFLRGGGGIGGHSFVLDILAHFGLIGLVLLVWMYRTIYIKFFLPYKKKENYGYVVWTFVQTLFLSIVNTGGWLPVLAIFVPVFLKIIYEEKQ